MNASVFKILFLTFTLGLVSASFGQDKFRTKGRFNVQTGLGFGINNLSNNQTGDKNSAGVTGIFTLGGDYGFTPLISAGINLFNNPFAILKDSSEKDGIVGIGVYGRLNFGRRPNTIWYWNLGFGSTGFTYENFRNEGKLTSSGAYISTGVGMRRYFGDHFGLFADINLTGYNYNRFYTTMTKPF